MFILVVKNISSEMQSMINGKVVAKFLSFLLNLFYSYNHADPSFPRVELWQFQKEGYKLG